MDVSDERIMKMRMKLGINFHIKGLLSRMIKGVAKHWDHYFTGFTIGNYGIGVIWRRLKKK